MKSIMFLIIKTYRYNQQLFLRYGLALIIGVFVLRFEQSSTYDFRFQLRGNQQSNTNIIVVNIGKNDLPFTHRLSTVNSDNAFWNYTLWKTILTKSFQSNVAAIGISFYFSGQFDFTKLSTQDQKMLLDPKVVWSSAVVNHTFPQWPLIYNAHHNNYGFVDFIVDEDGSVRKFSSRAYNLSHFSIQLAKSAGYKTPLTQHEEKTILNYRGDETVFKQMSLSEFLLSSQDELENKILIFGSDDTSEHLITPHGIVNRATLLAHILDNIINQREISQLSMTHNFLILLILIVILNMIIKTFPSSLAFIIMIFISLFLIVLSIWSFDRLHIWLPLFAPISLISSNWIFVVGYYIQKTEQKNWQLQQEKKSILELEQLKNNFVSLISHDLKTPLSKIQAIIDRLLLKSQDAENLPELKNVRLYSDELLQYIQKVLQLLRIEARDFKITMEVLDVNEILIKAIQDLKPLAQEKNILIDLNLEPLFSVDADPTLLYEIILNLVENAIKYNRPSGKINVCSFELNNKIHITIEDNGYGISDEEQKYVFNKFYRGKDQDLKTKGTGLGLYLVKYFTELHKGEISLKSQKDKGTQIILVLPIH